MKSKLDSSARARETANRVAREIVYSNTSLHGRGWSSLLHMRTARLLDPRYRDAARSSGNILEIIIEPSARQGHEHFLKTCYLLKTSRSRKSTLRATLLRFRAVFTGRHLFLLRFCFASRLAARVGQVRRWGSTVIDLARYLSRTREFRSSLLTLVRRSRG